MKRLIRSILTLLGWLAACFVFYWAMTMLDLLWNFFDWSPKFDPDVVMAGLEIAGSILAIWLLARITRDKVSQTGSCVLCVILVAVAVVWAWPETVSDPHFFKSYGEALLARRSPSPLWFRGGRVLVMALPAMFWVLWFRRHRRSGPALLSVHGRPI